MGEEHYSGLSNFGGVRWVSTGPSDWHGVEARLLSTAWAGHKLMAGFEYQDITRRDQASINTTDPADPFNVIIRGKGWRMGLYVQDEWALTPQLSTTLGLRADRNRLCPEPARRADLERDAVNDPQGALRPRPPRPERLRARFRG